MEKYSFLFLLLIVTPIFILVFSLLIGVALNLARGSRTIETLASTISDDCLVKSDGEGPYVSGVEYVSVKITPSFEFDTRYTPRAVFIRFEEASWKNEEFKSIAPLIHSGFYFMYMGVTIYSYRDSSLASISPLDMKIGECYGSNDITLAILISDVATGEPIATMIRGFVGLADGAITTPPPGLFNEGYVNFMRVSENIWIIEGDAWFNFTKPYMGGAVEGYVKLSFRLSVIRVLPVRGIDSTLIVYRLHCHPEPIVAFSENRLIKSDGRGLYKSGAQGIRVTSPKPEVFLIDLTESLRYVYVGFGDAVWKDEDLSDIIPTQQSGNYRALLTVENTRGSMGEMHVGERTEPDIEILFYSRETGQFEGLAIRSSKTAVIPLESGYVINCTAPEPPPSLYNGGYIELIRVGGDTWIIDADAWFTFFRASPGGKIVKYYVHLSFKMAIVMKA